MYGFDLNYILFEGSPKFNESASAVTTCYDSVD